MNIDMNWQAGDLNPIWRQCVGAGRAKEGLRADWQRQLMESKKACGFRYLRFHGLLHDDMFVYREEDGKPCLNFQYVDALFDFLLRTGIRPFVEFGFMPADLARETATIFWWKGNGAPPVDEGKWTDLIVSLVRHWIDRYGEQEVLQWYFEVWNEPNLHPFFKGTKSEYFRLYQITSLAVKSVDRRLRVGGPATSNFVPDERFDGETEDKSKHLTHTAEDINTLQWHGVWIRDFLAFCEKNHLPLDFVSTHPYPTDFALDGHGKTAGKTRRVSSLREDLEWLHSAMRGTAYENAEIHLTEWSTSPSSRDFSHDFLPAATYVMKCNLDVADMADSLSYWTFTDIFEEAGGGPAAFHGGFGLINMQDIKKPTFYAYQFLNRLGPQLVDQGDYYAVTKREDGKAAAVFYHYPEEYRDSVPMSAYPNQDTAKRCQEFGTPRQIAMLWSGLRPGSVFRLETVTRDNVAIEAWNRMGQPVSPSPAQAKTLRSCAEDLRRQLFTADENGVLHLEFCLESWEIASLVEV